MQDSIGPVVSEKISHYWRSHEFNYGYFSQAAKAATQLALLDTATKNQVLTEMAGATGMKPLSSKKTKVIL